MPTLSRLLIAKALRGVFEDQKRVSEHWDDALSGQDALFAQALLGLCLRHWGILQHWITPRLKTPERGLPWGSHIPLAMGLAQLAWLPGVSTHAAVNESVELVSDPKLGFPAHKGLCNAILRSAAKDRNAFCDEMNHIPASHDRNGLTERLLSAALAPRQQGDHREALWARLQTPPRPSFVALDDAPLPPGLQPDPRCNTALHLAPDAPFPRAWLASGSGMVQDISSQALMAFAWDGTPKRILDACAAPGGKSTWLAKRWPQAQILALESHPKRAERLKSNLALRKSNVQVETADAIAFLQQAQQAFDLILLDAPCSGTGTLQKHPELRWLENTLDLKRLCTLQRKLIQAALPRLAPGGCLIYAVCSWLPEEGREALQWTLAHYPDWHPLDLWPDRHQVDHLFCPDPLAWEGEGFQAWACKKGTP